MARTEWVRVAPCVDVRALAACNLQSAGDESNCRPFARFHFLCDSVLLGQFRFWGRRTAGVAVLLLAARSPVAAQSASRTGRSPAPNVVFLVADDLGYADLGVQGARDLPTPSIDRIAREGARFTNGYMVASLCSPSRAGILTGRYPQRWGQEFNPSPTSHDSTFGIPASVPTLAERLKKAGYATGLVGKWHLGYFTPNTPTSRGFDEFFGFLGATHRYMSAPKRPMGPLLRGATVVAESSYITDAFGREAVSYINRHHQRPFFLVVAFNAVHVPVQADQRRLTRLAAIADPERRTYGAALVAMDDAIGGILEALDVNHIASRTIVVFVGDNGGATLSTRSSNGVLQGVKGLVNEGGIRVPFLIRWPSAIPPATVIDAPVSALDLVPTVLRASGLKSDSPVDGMDIAPLWRRPGERPASRTLYWRLGTMHAVRDGDWKLVVYESTPPRLYDVAADPGEHRDLARNRPDVVQRLTVVYRAWEKQMVAPRWGRSEGQVRPPVD